VYDTVGEETAGRGPIIICGDGSGSMGQGEPSRNTWLRAIGMTLLNTARREKRDFAFIEWASNYSSTEADFKVWQFPAKAGDEGRRHRGHGVTLVPWRHEPARRDHRRTEADVQRACLQEGRSRPGLGRTGIVR
jgi:hypothetical protein